MIGTIVFSTLTQKGSCGMTVNNDIDDDSATKHGDSHMEPLSSLTVRKCPPSAALAAPKSLSFSSASAATGTLAPSILLLFLVFTCSSQKLFQISFLNQGQSLPDFVPRAAQPFFLLLVAKCHPQNQVSDEECHLAPQSLGWSCCVGSRCLHRSVKCLQSNCCIPAVQSSRDPLDCLQLRERVVLREYEEQMLVTRSCLRHQVEEVLQRKVVWSVQWLSLQVLCPFPRRGSLCKRRRWHAMHV